MLRLKYLFAFVGFLLTVSIASGYSVILKSGKTVDGVYLRETDTEILVKDKDGITLAFRKSTLDLDAMKEANSQTSQGEEPGNVSKKESDQTKPVEKKKSESKPKKIFTNEDLKDLPELSIVGSENPQEIPEEEATEEEANEGVPELYSSEAEAYWKDQTRELANHLYEAEDSYNLAQKDCEDAKKAFGFYFLNGYWASAWSAPSDPAYICDQASQAKAEYDRWLIRLEEFQERARKEGALPGWIDPERLDR